MGGTGFPRTGAYSLWSKGTRGAVKWPRRPSNVVAMQSLIAILQERVAAVVRKIADGDEKGYSLAEMLV
jgi:hypothetical protein